MRSHASWKVLEKWPWKLRFTEISHISSTKFGQLILSKIVKIVATRCHILRLKCTKFDFGWGYVPYPRAGELSATPRSPSTALQDLQLDLVLLLREGKGENGSGGEGRVFSIYLSIRAISWAPKRSWKISHGGPGKSWKKSWIFLSVKEWEPWSWTFWTQNVKLI